MVKQETLNKMKVMRLSGMAEAYVENIHYHADRHLDKELIQRLATGIYLENKQNIILMGA